MKGSLYKIETEHVLPVKLEEVKKQLKLPIDDLEEDDLLLQYIEAATEEAERYIEKNIIPQKYKLVYPAFPDNDPFHLPKNPVIQINAVKYVDPDGEEKILPEEKYTLISSETDEENLQLQFADILPDVKDNKIDAVRIEFTAGMVKVPKAIKQAILRIVTNYYELRGDVVERLPKASESILRKYRKFN